MHLETVARLESDLRPTDHPYLTGPFTPNLAEVNATDMEVIGRIPDDIDGVYLRNTQNQIHQPLGRFHPFDSDGMLHMMRFKDGRAEYRNRAIRTTGFEAERAAGHSLWAGLMEPPAKSRPGWGAHGFLKDASSTDVVVHAGRALTTYYQCGDAYRLSATTLEQYGPETWGGGYPREGVSAHCKVDEHTGELLFFNYSKRAPYMHYGVVGRDNVLKHYVPVPLPGPRLPHDMAFTGRYSILNDFPLFWDPEMLKRNLHVVRFYPELKSRFAVIPRYGQPGEIRWFEAAPTFVLHFLNAYEDGDEIVMDGYFQESPMPVSPPDAPELYKRMMVYLDQHAMKPHLHRWRFNLATGTTREEKLDGRVLEFGMFNMQYAGRPYRYAYSAVAKPGWFLFTGLVKHDLVAGTSQEIAFGDEVYGSESPFAPRVGAKDEDDGYLVSFMTDMKNDRSECWLVDCKRFADGPVARIILPHRIASGTHSTWANGRDLQD
ncbi:MAG: carotenoid oxygenase family protein [Burkholderiales bacterium]|nr:carotenoid oxygenase family protein [Burkholderiales bacterium]